MNLCVATADGHLVTPVLGTILDGVTRGSVLELAADHDLTAVERPISIDELRQDCATGAITEVFAAGTAAVLSPIVRFKGERDDIKVADGQPGKHTLQLRQHMFDIQNGRTPDTHGWMRQVV